MKTRAALLVLLLCAPPALARDASGRLDALVLPNECNPALLTAGGSFQALLRGADDERPVSATMVGPDAAYSLELKPAGRGEPDGSAWFSGEVPAEAPAGGYALAVEVAGQHDRNQRCVFVLEEVPSQYTIAHVTDVHIGDAPSPAVEAMRAVAAEVNAARPLLVLITGDITGNGSDEQYRQFVETLSAFEAPTFVCSGNHDRGRPTLDSVYPEFCGPAVYHFDVGQDRFAVCDTQFHWTDWQRDPQWAQVVEALRAQPATRWRMLVGHRYEPAMSFHLQRYLYGGRIQAFVHGHWHRNFLGQFPGGTQWIATGAATAGYWRLLQVGADGVEAGEPQRAAQVPLPVRR